MTSQPCQHTIITEIFLFGNHAQNEAKQKD